MRTGVVTPVRAFTPLRPGDAVAVVAPSSPIRADMLEEGLREVRRLGYEPVLAGEVAARWRFTAGPDERRLAELERALAEPRWRAVWCARGGAGLTGLLRGLDPAVLARDPKPIVGESDATALGSWALRAGVGWIHGPMVAGALRTGSAGYDEGSLRAALAGEAFEIVPGGVEALREGEAEGVLWGGCLSLLAALAGTPWLAPTADSLLVVEDVGVKPYQVHRMLVQLRDAGLLDGVRGVLLGDFSDCVQHVDQGYDVRDVIAELLEDALGPVPVSIGWPIGHATAPHVALRMGARARLVSSRSRTALHLHGA